MYALAIACIIDHEVYPKWIGVASFEHIAGQASGASLAHMLICHEQQQRVCIAASCVLCKSDVSGKCLLVTMSHNNTSSSDSIYTCFLAEARYVQ